MIRPAPSRSSTDATITQNHPVDARTWIGFIAMCIGMFMAVLDIQVVASSLPQMAASLHIPEDRLSWIQTSYLMAEIVAIPLTGLLTRAFSVRWLFAGATLAFTAMSLGCALSTSFGALITLRTLQGFCGGVLIPAVFTTVFALFQGKREALATTVAGTFAVLAPTIGPALGGFLTQNYSWHAIFLINIIPGLLVSAAVARLVRVGEPKLSVLRHIDGIAVVLAGIFLGTFELGLKEGPKHHWRGIYMGGIAVVCLFSGVVAIRRCFFRPAAFVDLGRFRDRAFACGSVLNFLFGMGLFGCVYLLPVFLGYVRHHSALEIGSIMIVMGAAQLVIAPLAAYAETRVDARMLALIGFLVFAAGLGANAFENTHTDFWQLFWPQILRGAAVMFCLLPATRLALNHWQGDALADASALFNLMRNLGGAIGIALCDTILEQRTVPHVTQLVARLQAGDPNAAKLVGLPTRLFHYHAMAPVDPITKAMIQPMIERVALVQSFNEAWMMLAGFSLLALLALPLVPRTPPPTD